MFFGGYPLGAQYDPRAPWNEVVVAMSVCPDCGGKGRHWYACRIETYRETECTEEAWLALPSCEAEAVFTHDLCIRGGVDTCETCDGEGEVEQQEDHRFDYDY